MLRRIWNFLGKRPATATASPPIAAVADPTVIERSIPASRLDPDAVKIVNRLTRHDHEAYLVGGCVRDLLLGRQPKDFDVGTSATPRQVKRLFRNCRIIGRRFRLAHVYFSGGKIIEVATFRSGDDHNAKVDGADDLLIRDDNQFGTVEQDALRRDFTINQLFFDVSNGKVLDHIDGLDDLERRLIRTIGDPAVRFREDPIRILRAIKFAARLDFGIEEATLAALKATRNELPKAAPPRVLEEINRFCRGAAGRRSFELLRETEVLEVILPEWSPAYRDPTCWQRGLHLLGALDTLQGDDYEVPTGLILATLVLPMIWETIGWDGDGPAEPRRGLQVREIVEEQLHPVALRLRISRREQERCRQILVTLHRMVPGANLRGRVRHSILQRPAFHEAMALLAALSENEHEAFAQAFELWRERGEGGEQPAREPRQSGDDADGEIDGDRPKRRRRRRRRKRGGSAETENSSSSSDETSPARDGGSRNGVEQTDDGMAAADRPARGPRGRSKAAGEGRRGGRWDDNYFFAALPSVPAAQVQGTEDDRYGAGQLLGTPRPTSEAAEDDEPDTATARPRRRRGKRGGRRRSRGSGGGETAAASAGDSADSGGKES